MVVRKTLFPIGSKYILFTVSGTVWGSLRRSGLAEEVRHKGQVSDFLILLDIQ